jgi:pyridoxamine 5'-phosphate oxidase
MSTRLASLTEIEAAVWRELDGAARDKQHPWRTAVLATTDGATADARTVILREVDADERQLRVYTDRRSLKVAQLNAHPTGTLVMWSPALGWQLRLRVRMAVLDSGLAVSSRWARIKLTPGAHDYLSPLAPGSELPTPSGGGASPAPLPFFAVIEATVEALDWLELHPGGHRRAAFDAAGGRWLQP